MARKVIDVVRNEGGGIVGLRCTQCGCLRAPDEFFKGQASHGRRMPCKPCNSRKHNRELEAFFDRFGGKVEFCKRRTLGLFRLRAGAVNQCR